MFPLFILPLSNQFASLWYKITIPIYFLVEWDRLRIIPLLYPLKLIREKQTKSRHLGWQIMAVWRRQIFPNLSVSACRGRGGTSSRFSQLKTYGFSIIWNHLGRIIAFNIRVKNDFWYRPITWLRVGEESKDTVWQRMVTISLIITATSTELLF